MQPIDAGRRWRPNRSQRAGTWKAGRSWPSTRNGSSPRNGIMKHERRTRYGNMDSLGAPSPWIPPW